MQAGWMRMGVLRNVVVSLAALLLVASIPARSENDAKAKFKIGTSQETFNLGTAQLVLAWEKWHKRVTRALTKNIRSATLGLMGSARIRVTIDKDHHLTSQLIESDGDSKLGNGCLEGVRKLDGDVSLAFPDGTKREQITFDFSFKRAPFIFPRHGYIKDDFETVDD